MGKHLHEMILYPQFPPLPPKALPLQSNMQTKALKQLGMYYLKMHRQCVCVCVCVCVSQSPS